MSGTAVNGKVRIGTRQADSRIGVTTSVPTSLDVSPSNSATVTANLPASERLIENGFGRMTVLLDRQTSVALVCNLTYAARPGTVDFSGTCSTRRGA